MQSYLSVIKGIMKLIVQFWLIPICFILGLSACSVTQDISDDEVRSKYADLSPRMALQRAMERYSKAMAEQYDYYSPTNWNSAGEALQEAQKIAKTEPQNLQILKKSFIADRSLDSATYVKKSALDKFAKLFRLQIILLDNEVNNSYSKQYSSLNGKIVTVLDEFENLILGVKTENATQKYVDLTSLKIENKLEALNIKVVKHNYLSSTKKDLSKLKTMNAAKIIPITYKAAKTALKEANSFIENNVYNQNGVESVSQNFRFAVNHAAHVIDSVIGLSKKEITQLEQVVLSNESNLHQIAQALSVNDLRDRPLPEQTQLLLQKVNGVYDHHTEKSSMIIDLSEENVQLQLELKALKELKNVASEKMLNKLDSLKAEIQTLEREKHDLKQSMAKLEQKNIDLAIEIAEMTTNSNNDQDIKSGKVSKDTESISPEPENSKVNIKSNLPRKELIKSSLTNKVHGSNQ